jgi:N-acetyl sugar amidotransferase
MDAGVPGIRFDAEGRCNYCTDMLARSRALRTATPEQRAADLARLVERIKRAGRGKRYDCVVGVSGGVDSTWALLQVIELGLRPLAVHMDNGWNSELAQHNIEQMVKRSGVDLYTHVIDWREYRKLMQAFFDADVVDVELLYDNAMAAVNLQQASAFGVKYILSGVNQATEGMRMPPGWNWFKRDRRNILAIWRRFGDGSRLRTFPAVGTLQTLFYTHARGIEWLSFLDYFDYDKPRALAELKDRFGYKPYPYKHYESVFTRFYQGYILPRKFGIDKRRLHFSTLVVSGQMSREAALADLQRLPYPNEQALEQDITYFLKKMRWTRAQLDEYLARPGKPHALYGSEHPVYRIVVPVTRRLLGWARA